MTTVRDLESGALHPFADPTLAGIPAHSAGVYTVWHGEDFIYVGIGGVKVAAPVSEGAPVTQLKGLRGRLNAPRTGQRSGNKFCIYICDRFVLPELSRGQIADVANGRLSLDRLTREFVQGRLLFRYLMTTDGAAARRVEHNVRSGALAVGRPLLNPLPGAGSNST